MALLKLRLAETTESEPNPEGTEFHDISSVIKLNEVQSDLERYITRAWDAARMDKSDVTHEIETARRERKFKYDPIKAAQIVEAGGNPDVFLGLGDDKARKITSLIEDLILGQGIRPWSTTHTPIPSIAKNFNPLIEEAITQARSDFTQSTGEQPPQAFLDEFRQELTKQILEEVLQEAKEKSELMQLGIDDLFIEGEFYKALKEFIYDLSESPSAVLKGPFIKNKPELSYDEQSDGSFEVVIKNKLKPYWERVDPANYFPGPNAKTPQDTYSIQVGRLRLRGLEEMRNTPGANNAAIDKVMKDFGDGGLTNWLGLFNDATDNDEFGLDPYNPEASFDMLMFYGDVKGDMLKDFPTLRVTPEKMYSVILYKIGRFIVKASLNFDPLGAKPFYVTSFDKRPGSIWGRSPMEIIRPFGNFLNAAVRALAANMGLASGPQVAVNVDHLAKGEEITTLKPWHIWQFRNSSFGANGKLFDFYQPDDRAGVLISVIEFFQKKADEYLGLTNLLTGQAPVSGAGRTSSGLSMLITNASRFIKQAIQNIDVDVLEPAVASAYRFIMKYGEDDTMKGDIRVKANGTVALAIQEATQMRIQELLATTNNPADLQIMGLQGRATLLRESAKGHNIDVDDLIPPEQLRQLEAQIQQGAVPPQQQAVAPGQPQPLQGPSLSQEFLPGTNVPTTDFFSNRQIGA